MNRESSVVAGLFELLDQAAVLDFALADADLHGVFAGVAKIDVTDILQNLVVALLAVFAADEVARVERDAEAFDIVA